MDFSQIFLLFFLLIFPTSSTAQSCSISKCINDDLAIRFPFRIPDQQPARCGYPGFSLACNKAGVATLNLSSSEQFLVRGIDYVAQQIQLYDPDVCLPRRLLFQGLKLNLSNSPFMLSFSKNFTFLSCPSQFAISRLPVLSCISNSTISVVATSSMNYVKSMSSSCKIMATLPVPISYPNEASQFLTDHYGDLVLTWNGPACSICETEGRLCGYKSNTGQGIALNFRGEQCSQNIADYLCGDCSTNIDVCLWIWLLYLLRKVGLWGYKQQRIPSSASTAGQSSFRGRATDPFEWSGRTHH